MNPWLDDGDLKIYVGDCRDVLKQLPEESVHCVVTSPPYFGLRDYGTAIWEGGDPGCDHSPEKRGGRFAIPVSSKQASNAGSGTITVTSWDCPCGAVRVDNQIGLETDPGQYVEAMVDVFREVRRVLRQDGTCWLNLGDTYAANRSYQVIDSKNTDVGNTKASRVPSGLKPKDLIGIPWRVAFALQADGWWLRSDIVWAKSNPMPESTTDRPTKAHEYIFLLAKSPKYFFDAEAIKEPAEWDRWGDQTNHKHQGSESAASWIKPKSKEELQLRGTRGAGLNTDRGDLGRGGFYDGKGWRNPRSVWSMTTQGYAEAHFATFPEELPRRCIKAGTSEKGCCPDCGAPWVREMTEKSGGVSGDWKEHRAGDASVGVHAKPSGQKAWDSYVPPQTTGWRPGCFCGHEYGPGGEFGGGGPRVPVPCVVMDPFGGAATTGLVARELGRRSVLIELSESYAKLAAKRLQQLSLLA